MSLPFASRRLAQASNGPGCGGPVLVRVLSVVCSGAGGGALVGCLGLASRRFAGVEVA